MTIGRNWVVLDTNIWIFGLRNQPDQPACAHLLRWLHRLYVKVPRQVLLELYANLRGEEMSRLFRLLNRYPDRRDILWEKVELSLIHKYQQLVGEVEDSH